MHNVWHTDEQYPEAASVLLKANTATQFEANWSFLWAEGFRSSYVIEAIPLESVQVLGECDRRI